MAKRTSNGRGPRDAVRFAFECPRGWESLSPTEHPSVRHCDHCDQAVYLCADAKDAKMHARVGHCVALPRRPTPKKIEVPHVRGKNITLGMLSTDPDPAEVGRPNLATLAWLVPLNGPQRGETFQLSEGATIIGSGEGAHIRLQDDKDVKPEHCRIVIEPQRFFIVDAKTDGQRVVLHDNDVFVVGNTSIGFKAL